MGGEASQKYKNQKNTLWTNTLRQQDGKPRRNGQVTGYRACQNWIKKKQIIWTEQSLEVK